MTEHEIVQSYKNAVNKQRQLQILSELTLHQIPKIVEILQKNGVDTSHINMSPKKRYIDWNNGLGAKAVRLHKQGMPYQEIADTLEVSHATLVAWYGRNGIRRRKKWDIQEIEQIYKLRTEGKKHREIASILNISMNQVNTSLRTYNRKACTGGKSSTGKGITT